MNNRSQPICFAPNTEHYCSAAFYWELLPPLSRKGCTLLSKVFFVKIPSDRKGKGQGQWPDRTETWRRWRLLALLCLLAFSFILFLSSASTQSYLLAKGLSVFEFFFFGQHYKLNSYVMKGLLISYNLEDRLNALDVNCLIKCSLFQVRDIDLETVEWWKSSNSWSVSLKF